MKVKYTGPSGTGVDLPLPDGRIVPVEQGGDTPEIPEDLALGLLEQTANWQPSDKAARVLLAAAEKTAAEEAQAAPVEKTAAEEAQAAPVEGRV